MTSKTFCLSSTTPFNLGNCQAGVDPTINYTYDPYGNVSTQTDPNNNRPTVISYDPTYTFPQTVTNAKGQYGTIYYDYRYGKPVEKYRPKRKSHHLFL